MAESLGGLQVPGDIPLQEMGWEETGRDPLKLPGPRLSPRRELGIPWRRPSALSLLGRDPGKPWYPRRDGESAFSFLTHLLADKLIGALCCGRNEVSRICF